MADATLATTERSAPPRSGRWVPLAAALVLLAGIIAASIYGKLTINLHGEYFNIAKAIHAGRGYADPFGAATGPTAWQAPLLPGLEATILWVSRGDASAVVGVLVVLHVAVLALTGLLVTSLCWRIGGTAGALGAACAFAIALVANFRISFEIATDPWLNLLFLNLFILVLGKTWPLERWPGAIGWGLLGGVSALANPVLSLVWAGLTLWFGAKRRAWWRLAATVLVAGLTLAPWTNRNYLLFGRLIPVKSNLGYEFFQAQCLQPPGVLTVTAIRTHPFSAQSRERQEYQRLGEADYVARKWEQFAEAVRDDPLDFLDRLASRFLCATLWYQSPNPAQDQRRPFLVWLNRFTHPLPFMALVVLLVLGMQRGWKGGLRPLEWLAIGIYILYLLPYVAASYYDRYAMPLVGVKVLLVIFAVERLATLRARADH